MKILVHNVERGAPPPRREGIERHIQRLEPDVAVILEAVAWRTKKVGEKILRALGGGEAYYCSARTGFDLAVLSRVPSRNPLRHPDLQLFHGLLSLEVQDPRGEWIRIHALHLSPSHEDHRAAELRGILTAIGGSDGMAEGIVGDLNAVLPGDTVGGVAASEIPAGVGPIWRQDKIPPVALDLLVRDGWIDLYREIHPSSPGYTFPASAPVVRYDYAFGNRKLRAKVDDVRVLEDGDVRTISDHLPLLITLR